MELPVRGGFRGKNHGFNAPIQEIQQFISRRQEKSTKHLTNAFDKLNIEFNNSVVSAVGFEVK